MGIKIKIGLYIFSFLALFGDFIANEKPLYCVIKGQTYFPVFRQCAVDLSLAKPFNYGVNDWVQFVDYERVVKTIIPYSANSLDLQNSSFKSPFAAQNVRSGLYRHWFGTDQLGRDVLAGMIAGTRVAFLIGIGTTFLAVFLGVFLGAIAGYFADDRVQISIFSLFLLLFFSLYSIFLAVQLPFFQGVCSFVLFLFCLFFFVFFIEKKYFFGQKKINIPFDTFLQIIINIQRAIPSLMLILVLVTLLTQCNLWYIILILAALSWMNIALLMRAEILKIKQLEYIEAAKSMGLSDYYILLRHAIPNTLSPIIVVAAMMVSQAILAESSLSFLGIGLPVEQVTWGSLLRQAQTDITAWWMAVFPGFAIFFTVILFNFISEQLTKNNLSTNN